MEKPWVYYEPRAFGSFKFLLDSFFVVSFVAAESMNLKGRWTILVIWTLCAFLSDAYRILSIFPYNGRSHHIMFDAILKALVRKGHRVDVMSYYPLKTPLQNYTDIFNFTIEHHAGFLEYPKRFKEYDDDTMTRFITTVLGNEVCELLGVPEIQKIIRNPPNDPPYDVVLAQYHTAHCYMALGWLLKIPVVGVTSTVETSYLEDTAGNPLNDAFYPRYYSKKPRLDGFWDRAYNFLHNLRFKRMYNAYTEPQTEIMRRHISREVPDIREIERSLALVLLNTYYTFHGHRPLARVLVEVGGVHIEENAAELPPKLKEWMDAATSGVVYFSFGSIVSLDKANPILVRNVCALLGKIAPVKVLVKDWSTRRSVVNLSDNIFAASWIPQISVLGHKNTRAFITHGGQMSTFEAVYHGVPVIGVPVYGDQWKNVDILVAKRMGVRVNVEDLMGTALGTALDTEGRQA
ncbi:hypothetical protein KM043_008895 [Ampulex compressa]|nr:hypothetical protein KM043_008895 [Ampulex compressa]